VIDGNGYTLQGSGLGYGIYLNDKHNVTITNIRIEDFSYGINLELSSNNNTITGNTITNNTYGCLLDSSSYNTITGNIITDNTIRGIWLRASSN
jgi:parallel beta-helix repeat protein